jgi:hypothetical protein
MVIICSTKGWPGTRSSKDCWKDRMIEMIGSKNVAVRSSLVLVFYYFHVVYDSHTFSTFNTLTLIP